MDCCCKDKPCCIVVPRKSGISPLTHDFFFFVVGGIFGLTQIGLWFVYDDCILILLLVTTADASFSSLTSKEDRGIVDDKHVHGAPGTTRRALERLANVIVARQSGARGGRGLGHRLCGRQEACGARRISCSRVGAKFAAAKLRRWSRSTMTARKSTVSSPCRWAWATHEHLPVCSAVP